jgi:hypothetical protein
VGGPKEAEMKLKHLTIAAMMVACWLLAGSCAIDDREGTVTLPLGNAGGGAGSGGSGAATPRLVVGTEAIDLGWVTTGFAARARIRVDNLGTAPLPAPAVGFAAGSHADFSLIQNGCARGIAPSESCELRVQLVPSTNGDRSATLGIRSEAGGDAEVVLSGVGLAGGDMILAPVAGSFEDFGGTRVGSTQEESFSISNPSDVASGPLRFRSNRPEFALLPAREGDCVPDVTSLVGGQSCTLRLAFAPLERGPFEGTLTAASDGAGAVSLTIVGRGLLPPALSASAPAVDFSSVVLGSSGRRSVVFENAGDEPLTLAGARLAPEAAEGYSILNSDCGEGTELAGGASCSVQLEFRPTRVGEELTAELVAEGIDEGQAQSVALRGLGLEPGALTVSAAAEGDNDFGEVLLGASSERKFQIQNPSAQPSGVLDFALSEGFTLAPPSAAITGECVVGSTSLVNGESCTVRVLFAPVRREVFTASLTVSSALAGAADLALTGRGIMPARLAVEPELNFGRVLTGASNVRTFAIENAGDQPLPPPRFELSGNSQAQVAAFSFESHCTAALAIGAGCAVDLTFAPTVVAPHAVTLSVNSEAGDSSVLLLGEALVPGSLVLTASDSAAFGDVPIGTSATRQFILSNPGTAPSGRLTISSDNNRFEVDLGDCNQADAAGLVEGASCTSSVTFTPNDDLPQMANLTVQSPGAGRAGLQISGRGRLSASLLATGNRDLGRANVGQDALTQPQNEFTWTVNNQGDLPTGTLAVQNDNPDEFPIRNDSCSGSSLLGRASCQMSIRFLPSAAGNRAARVVVSDPAGVRPATLALTGLGVQLAQLGQSCVNAECAAGVCTGGVCCNRACDRTCQVCSAQGECTDQSSQEACGNGAACFGVDNCKLPAGRACSQIDGDAQCGSGNCEARLGGSGGGDRICCLDDCGTSLQCNAQNRCQAPALGAGEPCGAAGQQACGAGLECKDCRGGGRQCTAPNDCCGGCDNPLECSSGACVCPVLSNGQRGLDCGGGVCAINRQNACCVGFEPAGCNCDPRDNLCKQCLDAGDCAPGPAGTRAQCNNNTCSYPCDTQNGFRSCNGTCIANNQCCADTDCSNPCQACNTNSHSCGALGARPDRCPGTQVCSGNGQCVAAGGPPGTVCSQNVDCQSNDCRNWSPDGDGDGFGAAGVVVRRCGPPGQGFVANADDCCDSDSSARPNQTDFFNRVRNVCGGFDFNCDGTTEPNPPMGPCTAYGIDNCPGVISSELNCGGNGVGGAGVPIDGNLALCSAGSDCMCQGVRGAQSAQTCR